MGDALRFSGADIHNLVSHVSAYIPLTTQQTLSGAGAVDVTSFVTKVTTTGADALTLADAAVDGQWKLVTMEGDGGDGTLTLASAVGNNTITFADVGDTVLLVWSKDQGGWIILWTTNLADGATEPATSLV